MSANDAKPCLIGLDWGTSSLRAWLVDSIGRALDSRHGSQGIMQVRDGDYASVFYELVSPWIDAHGRLPAIACGMIGSRGGWAEVEYVATPADPAQLAGQLQAVSADSIAVHIIPGVMQGSVVGQRPDVMRGEETQVLGALASQPTLAEDSLLIMPGTHSKWVLVHQGYLVGFNTYMTGELFAVLRQHSILGKPMDHAGDEDTDAFICGVDTARKAGATGLSAVLFSARSRMLAGDIQAAAVPDYLSGLLIGDELRSALTGRDEVPPVGLIGEAGLRARYRQALTRFGIDEVIEMADAARTGLVRIADQAGLLTSC